MERIVERLEALYELYDKRKKAAYEDEDWEDFDRYMNVNRGIFEAIAIVKNELNRHLRSDTYGEG